MESDPGTGVRQCDTGMGVETAAQVAQIPPEFGQRLGPRLLDGWNALPPHRFPAAQRLAAPQQIAHVDGQLFDTRPQSAPFLSQESQ